jgi:hypothetical protein
VVADTSVAAWAPEFVKEQIGWEDDCARSYTCFAKAEVMVAINIVPWGRVGGLAVRGAGRAITAAPAPVKRVGGWLAGKLGRGGSAGEAGTSLVKYDADFALAQLTRSGSAKASELVDFAGKQGWTRVQTATGPIKYVDENDVVRLTIKSGSPRAPGSNFPHVEVRNAAGQRVDSYGNAVTRRSPGNHTPIEWDLP